MNRRKFLISGTSFLVLIGLVGLATSKESIIIIRSIKRYGFAAFHYGVVVALDSNASLETLLEAIKKEVVKYSTLEESELVANLVGGFIEYNLNEQFHPIHEDGGSMTILRWSDQLEQKLQGFGI